MMLRTDEMVEWNLEHTSKLIPNVSNSICEKSGTRNKATQAKRKIESQKVVKLRDLRQLRVSARRRVAACARGGGAPPARRRGRRKSSRQLNGARLDVLGGVVCRGRAGLRSSGSEWERSL
ncbi:uridylate kinase [Striga asiatica]|uniref:Uridylate kinase n=1 Tax=Striga asiatica TaxID=4170 RepID=A0A5A7P6D8_STRAF|nr:uridylate kinase [Striga asiatica]